MGQPNLEQPQGDGLAMVTLKLGGLTLGLLLFAWGLTKVLTLAIH